MCVQGVTSSFQEDLFIHSQAAGGSAAFCSPSIRFADRSTASCRPMSAKRLLLCNPLHLARKAVGQAFPLDSLTAAKKSKSAGKMHTPTLIDILTSCCYSGKDQYHSMQGFVDTTPSLFLAFFAVPLRIPASRSFASHSLAGSFPSASISLMKSMAS